MARSSPTRTQRSPRATMTVVGPGRADDGIEIPKPTRGGRSLGGAGTVAVLLTLLAVSAILAIGLGPAVVAPADTVRYLWAAVTGGRISADEVTHYQIIWRLRTPRVLLAAVVGAGLGALAATVLVYLASLSAGGVTPLRLVLTGVALSFGFQAVMGVIVVVSTNPATKEQKFLANPFK